MVRKKYAGILVDRFCRVTEGLIDDEEESFESQSGFVNKIFTLKHIGKNEGCI